MVEVTNIRTYSRKMNKLWNIHTMGTGQATSPSRKGEVTVSKLKCLKSSISNVTMPFVMDKSKSKTGLQYQINLP